MIYDSRGRDPQAPYDAYKDAVRTFYERETDRHGFNFRALGYKQRTSQQRRFAVLAEVGDLDGRSVLDVGCGLGDFVVHLSSRGIVPDYTGIDLCDHFVSACRRKFERPTGGPRFLAGDILDHERKPPYDYVVSCGLFGLRAEGTEVRVEATLRRMFDLCSRAVAVNFVSARVKHRDPTNLYLEPQDVLALAWELTPALALRHDYLPHDFTLYLFREKRWPDPVLARGDSEGS